MSDQNKFVNSYIDNALGMSFEYMKQVVQLKTQLSLVNDLVQQKDEVISSLSNEKEQVNASLKTDEEKIKSCEEDLQRARDDAKKWEAECASLSNKVSHMDTLTNQFNQMKQDLIAKNNEVTQLKNDLNNCKNLSAVKDTEINKINDLVKAKDNEIVSKDQEINNIKSQIAAKDNEINDLKSQIVAKDNEIDVIKKDLEDASKKVINTKVKSKSNPREKIIETGDDF